MSEHYCGCPDDCDESEWCCGGDAHCDSVESEPGCVEGLSHRWTSDGCGGCSENPGVWSLGGTTYKIERRCRYCGTARVELNHGWQRNPGECDSVKYKTDAYPVDAAEVRAERARLRRNALARRRRRVAAPARAVERGLRALAQPEVAL